MSSIENLADRIWTAAAANAERLALWATGESFSYAQLTDLAARAASRLLDAGIMPGDRIAILARRSIVAYAGILAAVRAGCVYVPLNPRFPLARNREILGAAGATALIVDEASAERFGDLVRQPPPALRVLVTLDGVTRERALTCIDAAEIATARPRSSWPARSAGDLCYLLFTSGSTGAPKGVPISHRNLRAYLEGIAPLTRVTHADRIAQLVDLTFDLSVHDMFVAWTRGAALYSVPEQGKLTITAFVAEHAITGLFAVPSIAALARKAGELTPGCLASLRFSLFAGEVLPGAVAQAWAIAAPQAEVYNLYGPTETTIACSWHRYTPSTDPPAVVPIGRPFHEQQFMIDGDGQLLISGSQLMPGYWQVPELDVDKLVTIDGVRWYRSGDLVRASDADGFHFVGRIDQQTKILGYRVELLEIEGVLRAASSRDLVAVIPWPVLPEGGAEGTVAFVVGEPLDEPLVFGAMRDRLPPYMVPNRLIYVDSLPLNANGKTDHGALRVHDALRLPTDRIAALIQARRDPSAPSASEIETEIVAVCAEVLRAPDLAARDGWIARGGDSLSAVLVVELARGAAGLELAMNAFTNTSTIGELARSAGVGVDRATSDARPYAPIPWQAFYIDSARAAGRPELWTGVHALTLEGPCEPRHLRLAVADLIERHDALRSRAITGPSGETWFAPMTEPALPWSERDVSETADAEAAWTAFCRDELTRGFDLDHGPLIRFALWRFDDQHHRLTIAAHHSITDHYSNNLRLEELMRAYHARRAGLPVGLGPPAPSLQAFAEWVQTQPTTAVDAYERSLADGLDDCGTALPPPRPGEPEQPRTLAATRTFDSTVVATARRFGDRHGLAPSSLLHGVWALVVAHLAREPDVFFSTFLSGRRCGFPRVDLVIGGLAVMAPIRIRVAPQRPAIEFLVETHRQLDRLREVECFIDPMRSPAPHYHAAPANAPGWPVTAPPFRQLRAGTFFSIQTAKVATVPFAPLRLVHESYAAVGQDCRELVTTLFADQDWRLQVTGSPRRFTEAQVRAMADTFATIIDRLDELERISLGALISGGRASP
ncbi:MAG: AMP-binding protein [Kofleriaceae bacterium]